MSRWEAQTPPYGGRPGSVTLRELRWPEGDIPGREQSVFRIHDASPRITTASHREYNGLLRFGDGISAGGPRFRPT
jgi:hypothetical protein